MKVLKTFFLVILLLSGRILGNISIVCPKVKVYFSKKVLLSGILAAKTQLSLGYSYYFKDIYSDLNSDVSQSERIKMQTLFHDMKKRSKTILHELDFLQEHTGKDIEKINFICFESLIKNLALLHEFFNYWGNLKLCFAEHTLLNQDVLRKLKSNNKEIEITFKGCCDLIEELLVFNDNLIKQQQVSLPPDGLFHDTTIPFNFGVIEYLPQEQFPVSSDFLFVSFQKITD